MPENIQKIKRDIDALTVSLHKLNFKLAAAADQAALASAAYRHRKAALFQEAEGSSVAERERWVEANCQDERQEAYRTEKKYEALTAVASNVRSTLFAKSARLKSETAIDNETSYE